MVNSILWFTGLPGSGKTTLLKKLHKNLKKNKIKTKVIDGDDFRNKISDGFYFLIINPNIKLSTRSVFNYFDNNQEKQCEWTNVFWENIKINN